MQGLRCRRSPPPTPLPSESVQGTQASQTDLCCALGYASLGAFLKSAANIHGRYNGVLFNMAGFFVRRRAMLQEHSVGLLYADE